MKLIGIKIFMIVKTKEDVISNLEGIKDRIIDRSEYGANFFVSPEESDKPFYYERVGLFKDEITKINGD